MPQLAQNLRHLATRSAWGYQVGGPSAAEPAALACLALACHQQHDAARLPAQWLAATQARDGSVGVYASQYRPAWPTSLAILAWNHLDATTGRREYTEAIARAVRWSLEAHGTTAPRQAHIGHDTTLTGWSWADDTHSWVEPTCMFVMALKAVGQTHHERTREAVNLLVDRLLPEGGCNYGNTIVLGQALLPHVQPTGLAMLALAGEDARDVRIEMSLAYLQQQLSGESSTSSLCYGLMGLAAHGRRPAHASAWLEEGYDRLTQRGASGYQHALIALASFPPQNWLRWAEPLTLSAKEVVS